MRGLTKIARDRLAAGQASTPHLDANLISAFAEHSLLPDERQRAIAHMSTCEQCRSEVQLVIGTAQADARGMVAASAKYRPSRQGFSRLLRWQPVTAALAIAALALGVFVSTRQRVSHASHPAAPAPVAMASKLAPPPSPPNPGGNARVVHLQAQVTPREADQKAGSAGGDHEAGDAKLALAKQLKSKVEAGQVSGQLLSDNATASEVERAEAREVVIAVPPPPSPQPAGVPAPALPAAAQQSAAAGVAGGVPASSAAARGVERAPAAMSVENFAADSSMARRRMIRALGPAVRWAVSADATAQMKQGAVERSLDGGRTWQPVLIAEGVTFRVVFALGSNVWAGGAAGAFYHSSDGGRHWSAIPLAATATAVGTSVGDIVSIQFADTTHGVVSASTGATWTTSDGGQTWQQAPQN